MSVRRYKLVEVPVAGPPAKDELTVDLVLLDAQLAWLEPQSAGAAYGLAGLVDGLKDVAAALGAPSVEVFPRSCHHD